MYGSKPSGHLGDGTIKAEGVLQARSEVNLSGETEVRERWWEEDRNHVRFIVSGETLALTQNETENLQEYRAGHEVT